MLSVPQSYTLDFDGSALTESRPMALTPNDRRVLEDIRTVLGEHGAYIPHSIADWTAIHRLEKLSMVCCTEVVTCQTCSEPHEDLGFAPTALGELALDAPVSTTKVRGM